MYVACLVHWHNPSGRTVALGSTQPLTEMSTRDISWGGNGRRCVGPTTLSPSYADCFEIWESRSPGTFSSCPGFYRVCFICRSLYTFERGVEANILKVFAAVVCVWILDLILRSNITHRSTSQTFRPHRVWYSDNKRFVAKYVKCFRTDLSRHTYVLHGAILLEKLTGSQLVKKFPAFRGTRMFITAFTDARHLSLPWARSIQSMPSPLNPPHSI
jgi:hypothetical protein